MKNLISTAVLIFILLSVNSLYGQDRIHLNNGKVIEGKIEKIGVKVVTIFVAEDKPVYSYDKKEIKVIIFADGSVETFDIKKGFSFFGDNDRKNGGVAVGLSIIGGAFVNISIPLQGLGQYYNGEYLKGTTYLGIGLISYGVSLSKSRANPRLHQWGVGLYFASWIASAIDAGYSAGKINNKLNLTTTQNLDGMYMTYSFSLSRSQEKKY